MSANGSNGQPKVSGKVNPEVKKGKVTSDQDRTGAGSNNVNNRDGDPGRIWEGETPQYGDRCGGGTSP